jgi:hypothetical protein
VSSSIDRQRIDLDTGALSPAGRVHDAVLGLGGEAAVVTHPSPRVALGVQFRTPPPQVFSQAHPELRYYTLGGYSRDLQATVASSARITGGLTFGFSITVDDTLLRLRFARDTALENGHGPGGVTSDCGGSRCGVENPAADETYDIKVHQSSPFSDGYIVNLGGMIQLARDTWLAVAYHTPPGGATSIHNTLTGSADVERPARDGGQVLHGGASVYVALPASVDAELRMRLPYRLDLHVGGRWQDLSRNTGYDVRMYGSTFPGANVPEWIERPRGFHDTFAMWAGVEQVDAGERWRFGARVGAESSALDDDRTSPITISPRSATLDLGAQLRVSSTLIVQLSYGLQYFPSVGVGSSAFDPRDRVACVDGGFDYDTPACAAVRQGFAITSAAGDYSRVQHALRLGIRIELP